MFSECFVFTLTRVVTSGDSNNAVKLCVQHSVLSFETYVATYFLHILGLTKKSFFDIPVLFWLMFIP